MDKKQLYHHCFEATKIVEGDVVPVGGGMIGSASMPWKVETDFSAFFPKFEGFAQQMQQHYLATQHIPSRLFSGEVMFDYTAGDVNFAHPHTFLIVESNGQEYVFDPANPKKGADGSPVFSLMKPAVGFSAREEDMKNDTLMVAAENVLDHSVTYYGVGDQGNVIESLIIHGAKSQALKDRPPETRTR